MLRPQRREDCYDCARKGSDSSRGFDGQGAPLDELTDAPVAGVAGAGDTGSRGVVTTWPKAGGLEVESVHADEIA